MRATVHNVTDRRQTDRQTDVIAYDNSRSYCVAVRSAKNPSPQPKLPNPNGSPLVR